MLKSYHFFLFVLIFSSCSNSQFKTLTGHWEGNMTSGGKTLEVKIDFNNDKCFFDIPQMGFFAQPFEDIQINGSKIELSVDKENEIIITGEIEKDKISAAIENTPGIFISLHKTSSSPEVYTEEEVSYKSGDIKLSGTLIYPKNSSPPHTAVVFIHGSGKMTRETMRNRAYMLVKNGFAALIYDRRGRGKSEGSLEQILPMNILAGDALAGVEFLKTRNDINKEQIGLFGLSQGGWVAPLCTSVSKDVAFIITVSASGITPEEQNEYVVKNMLSDKLAAILVNSKVPKNEIENILDNLVLNQKQFNENIQNEKEVVPGFSFFDPVPVWGKIKVPVLALWGEKDILVPAGESKIIIEKALINADNKDFTLKIFENSNHALKLVGTENKFSDKWEIVAPGGNELIINWLTKHFK